MTDRLEPERPTRRTVSYVMTGPGSGPLLGTTIPDGRVRVCSTISVVADPSTYSPNTTPFYLPQPSFLPPIQVSVLWTISVCYSISIPKYYNG